MWYKRTLLFFIFISTFYQLHASMIAHVAEISYRHLYDSTYEITYLETYCLNDMGLCDAGMGLMNRDVDVVSAKLNVNLTANLTRINTPYKFWDDIYSASCGGNLDIWHHKVFRGYVVLTGRSDDWVIKMDYGTPENRYDNVDVMNNYTISYGRKVYCTLNNLDFGNGNSSVFWYDEAPKYPGYTQDTILNYPYTYMCTYVDKNIDVKAYEYDGDSISYEISDPLGINGVPLQYKNGFSSSRPFPVVRDRDFKLLPGGFLYIKPDSAYFANVPSTAHNRFLIGIKVREFRKDTILVKGVQKVVWKEIGSNHRYFNIKVQSGSCDGADLRFIRDYTGNPDIEINCNSKTFDIGFNKSIKPSSIHKSDFIIKDIRSGLNSSLKSVQSIPMSNGYYNYFKIRFEPNTPLDTGEYLVTFKRGLDMTTLITDCDYEVKEFYDTMRIHVVGTSGSIMLPSRNKNNSYKKYIEAECQSSKLVIEFSDSILCSSIDSSDFRLQIKPFNTPNYLTVKKIEPFNCKDGLTNMMTIYFTDTIPEGYSQLSMIVGKDGNTVLNRCSYPVGIQGIQVNRPDYAVDLGENKVVCEGEKVNVVLDCGGGHDFVLWSTGETKRQIRVEEIGTYYVTIGNKFGCEASDTIDVLYGTCYVGQEKMKQESGNIGIYPNPGNGHLFIVSEKEMKHILLRIKNLNGQIVFEKQMNSGLNYEIDIPGPAGIYFLELNEENSPPELFKVIKR